MDEAISWGIALIIAILMGFIFGRCSDRRTSNGAGSDAGRIRDGVEGTAEDNRRAGELNRTAADQNQRAQNLVRRARDILNEAQHTDGNK